jgi:hypothetical protein
MLQVYLDFPFFIAPSVFANVYLEVLNIANMIMLIPSIKLNQTKRTPQVQLGLLHTFTYTKKETVSDEEGHSW